MSRSTCASNITYHIAHIIYHTYVDVYRIVQSLRIGSFVMVLVALLPWWCYSYAASSRSFFSGHECLAVPWSTLQRGVRLGKVGVTALVQLRLALWLYWPHSRSQGRKGEYFLNAQHGTGIEVQTPKRNFLSSFRSQGPASQGFSFRKMQYSIHYSQCFFLFKICSSSSWCCMVLLHVIVHIC